MNRSPEPDLLLTDQLLRHAGWSRRLARSLLGDDALADDAVQDAHEAALRAPPRLDRPLSPWLRVVLRNRAHNRRRAEKRRRALERDFTPAPEAVSPEERLAQQQTLRLLADLVGELAEPYRETVRRRYFEGHSASRIAADLGLPAATVRGRLRTALAELREGVRQRGGGAWMIALAKIAREQAASGGAGVAWRPWAAAPLAAQARWVLVVLLLASGAAWQARGRGRAAPPPAPPAAGLDGAGVGAAPAPPEQAPSPAMAGAGPAPVDQPPPAAVGAIAGGDRLHGRRPASHQGADPDGTGAVEGTVRLVGPSPPALAFDPPADPYCARFVPGATEPASEDDPTAVDGAVPGAVVRVVAGWRGEERPPAEQPVMLEQRGCRYIPRVLVARPGQRIVVQNVDEISHAVTASAGTRVLLSRAEVSGAGGIELRADRDQDVIRFACDDHPWMSAHVLVSSTPFAAVTAADGRFRLSGLPPGWYQLEVWHRRLGRRRFEVAVSAGATREAAVVFGADRPAPVVGGGRDCRVAIDGKSPVAQACQRGGVVQAKKVMKAMLAQGKTRGLRFECDSCHRNEEDWGLLTVEARRRFEELLAASR